MPKAVETEAPDPHLALHAGVAPDLPGSAPWIAELRARALTSFRALPWPTTRVEEWRYTSLKPVTDTTYRLPGPTEVTAEDLAPFTYPDLDAHLAVVVDGAFRPELSKLDHLPPGLSIRGLAEVLEDDPDLVRGSLGAIQDVAETKLAALNTLFLADGVVVHVADGVEVERPVHLLLLSTARGEATVTHPRILVGTGTSTQVTLLETHGSLGSAVSFSNVVTELDVGDDSRVDHLKLQRLNPASYHVENLASRQGRASFVRSSTVDLGGRLVRNDVNARFQDEGGELSLLGLYSLHGEQLVDNHTIIEHLVPHCSSRELYKGVLDDRSRGAFLGKIHVHPGAQKTDAYQHNPNMILSDGALVNTRPQLEIFADDVKCSHGSTIGQIDDGWIFYLRSRGLPEATARSLLIFAFVREVLERIPPVLAPVRSGIEAELLDRLPDGPTVKQALLAEP